MLRTYAHAQTSQSRHPRVKSNWLCCEVAEGGSKVRGFVATEGRRGVASVCDYGQTLTTGRMPSAKSIHLHRWRLLRDGRVLRQELDCLPLNFSVRLVVQALYRALVGTSSEFAEAAPTCRTTLPRWECHPAGHSNLQYSFSQIRSWSSSQSALELSFASLRLCESDCESIKITLRTDSLPSFYLSMSGVVMCRSVCLSFACLSICLSVCLSAYGRQS